MLNLNFEIAHHTSLEPRSAVGRGICGAKEERTRLPEANAYIYE